MLRPRSRGIAKACFNSTRAPAQYVVFHAPAVEKFKLLEKRVTKPMKVGGVGGTLDARIGPLNWFQIGGRRSEKLTALFLEPHEGALNDPYVAGTFGAGLLKGSKIMFDYPHQRIAFLR